MAIQVSRAPSWWRFGLWAVCGASGALTLLAAFTYGPLFLVAALALAGLALLAGGANISAVGLATGPGLLLLWVAWLNRDGPGDICHTTGTESVCTQEWSPWPWLAAGLVLIVVSLIVYAILAPRMRTSAARRESQSSSVR